MTDAPVRFTLRQLPLPAKLVLSCFLVAVGLGYFSALVQLHMQHSSRNGDPMPGVADVVAIFAGKKKADPSVGDEKPVSKLERLVMGPIEGAPWNGSGSMAAAFFHKDGAGYTKQVKTNPGLKAERETEQQIVRAWINTADADRQKAYEADLFPLPPELVGKPVMADYLTDDKGKAKIKYLLTDRCARCHANGQAQANFPLETYVQFLKYLEVPPVEAPIDGWVRSDRQVSIEKLTQSTHAHLLSFAVLFTLTGLVFSFSSYSTGVRCLLGPIVLVAQVADVSCWWLARLDGVGVYFAMAIIGTGGVVGTGLALQIVLGLFNMYGPKGKVVVAMLFLLGAAVIGAVVSQAIAPALDAQKESLKVKPAEPTKLADVKPDAAPPKPAVAVTPAPKPEGVGKKADAADTTKPVPPAPKPAEVAKPNPMAEKPTPPTGPAPKPVEVVKADPATAKPVPPAGPAPKPAAGGDAQKPAAGGVTHLERLVMGPIAVGPATGAEWNGKAKGSMAAAFFNKDGAGYAKKVAEKPAIKDEREGERKAVQAWIRLDDASRKAAFAADLLPLPKDLAGKPITEDYLSDDKAKVKIKSLLADRCTRCHTGGSDAEEYPLETYEQLSKYLKPEKR